MKDCKRRISKDIYNRIIKNNGHFSPKDVFSIFTEEEFYDKGIYSPFVYEYNNEYYVGFKLGK
jgi:hypothetical protein